MSDWKVRIICQGELEGGTRSDTDLLAPGGGGYSKAGGHNRHEEQSKMTPSEEPPEPDLKGGFAVDIF